MRTTNPIFRHKPQKRVNMVGELPPYVGYNAQPHLSHLATTPSLTSSRDIVCHPILKLVLTHHASKNTLSPPPQQERHTTTKKEGLEVFFPPKNSQTTELFGSTCCKMKKI
jgi:hypothetical protein